MKNKTIAIVLGTRPEIIKLAPIILYCEKKDLPYFVIHTNQHYTAEMDKIFFEELNLPKPKWNLNVGSSSQAKQTAMALERIEEVLLEEKPSFVFVQGDTNSALAGALAAAKIGIPVCHVEAGLRSYDRSMPEEINRVIIDHISEKLFPPTEKERKILIGEGISENKINVTGNTIVDSIKIFEKRAKTDLKKLGLSGKKFLLLTMHRPGNVDDKKVLKNHFDNIEKLTKKANLPVLFLIHPRTQSKIEEFRIEIPNNFIVRKPVGFFDMLALERAADVILTDSGGIQEEACVLQTPTLNLRENTERPESIEVGASIIVGNSYSKLQKGFDHFQNIRNRQWENPFGNGKSAERMIRIINVGGPTENRTRD